MDCLTITGDLVPFHFGTLDDAVRAAVEAHLATCPACLGAYFDVKRAVERKEAPRPSPALRTRLRQSVIADVRPRRSVAPYAAVAACLAIAAGLGVALMRHSPAPVMEAREEAQPAVQTTPVEEKLPPRFGGPIDSARDPNQRPAFY